MMAHEAVANGIAFLSERLGDDWLGRMDLDRLNIMSHSDCAACQATGIPNYTDALEYLGIKSGYYLGFTPLIPTGEKGNVYDEWCKQITTLREKHETETLVSV